MAHDVHAFPISLVLRGLRCLVVGGTGPAVGKVEQLCAAGAQVTVVAPFVDPAIAALDLDVQARCYEAGEAGAYRLVIAATGKALIDQGVAADAHQGGVLVNVVDDPAASSFIFPAIFRRGHLSVAVSTDGKSPAFATWERDEMARSTSKDIDELLDLVALLRARLIDSGKKVDKADWRVLIEAVTATAATQGIRAATEEGEAILASWLTRK